MLYVIDRNNWIRKLELAMTMNGTTHSYSDLVKMREYQNSGPNNSHHTTWTFWILSLSVNISYGNPQATVKYNDSVSSWYGSVG